MPPRSKANGLILSVILVAALVWASCASLPVATQMTTTSAATRVFLLESATFDQPGWTVPGDDRARELAILTAWAAHRGVIVATVDMSEYEGRTDGHLIALNGLLGTNDRLYTLLHELAHCLQPDQLSHGEAETFAELVAVQVYDADAWTATANYLRTNVPLGIQSATVGRYATQMDAAVIILRRALSGRA